MNDDPLIVVAGPTASGKTALGIELALRLNAEIVSADSQQVYRYFDIGTAKPSAGELAQVPHHLVSVVDPHEAFSAGRYVTLADQRIAEIRARGKRVVLVGGTGLYLRVLLHGVMEGPSAQPELRAEFTRIAETEGRPALHARLAQVDPETAAKLPAMDIVRVIRALEIHAVTGKPVSQHRREHGFKDARYPFRLFVLSPPRELLYSRINERTAAMFAGGLLDEVGTLVGRGFRDAPPMRCVGYKEALAVIDGTLSREEGVEKAAQETRHYAKRQLTWFKKEVGAEFVAPPYAFPF